MKTEQLRYCTNPKCPQFEIPHLFQYTKKCHTCQQKTKFIENADDCPPREYVDSSTNGKAGLHLLPASVASSEPMVFGAGTSSKGQQSDCDLKGCPIAPPSPIVCVPWPLYQKWVFLAHKIPVEWIAYLLGRFEEATDELEAAYVLREDGMYFPNQSASGAHVDAETCDELEGTIGSVHSHVGMPAEFSSIDYNNFSRAVELVVNRAGTVGCVTRVQLGCGKFERVKAKVSIIEAGEMKACLDDLKAKLIVQKESEIKGFKPTYYTPGKGWSDERPSSSSPEAAKRLSQSEGEPSDALVRQALKVLRRSSKFRNAEKLDGLMEST